MSCIDLSMTTAVKPYQAINCMSYPGYAIRGENAEMFGHMIREYPFEFLVSETILFIDLFIAPSREISRASKM
jgi:hypothetical protein